MVELVKKTEGLAPEKEMEGARRATGISFSGAATGAASEPVDLEVPAKATRRKFTARYKLDILAQAERCEPGEVGALLRREGLYSSHLTTWRRQQEEGALAALGPRKRGRKPKERDGQSQRLEALERENEKLRQRLAQAEIIIEVQKKVSTLLGIPLERTDREERS
jgi:transposase